jgi:rhomboid protease GluP
MPYEHYEGPYGPGFPVLLRTTHDRRHYEAWALVLVALGFQPQLRRVYGSFELWVPGNEAARASAELDDYELQEAEARREALKEAQADIEDRPATLNAAWGSAMLVLSLVAFYAVTGPNRVGSRWHDAGASNAEQVLHGQWWRAVTALTLHADTGHLLSNVGLGALVIGLVMRAVGVGWGMLLVLATGALGNFANAWAYQAHHSSIGFSTAVFGAVGLLGGLSYVHRQRHRASGLRPAWIAIGGAFALLGLLGTSVETDVLAHLFGACAGVGLGLAEGWRRWRPRSWVGQTLAGIVTAATVVGAWLLARA